MDVDYTALGKRIKKERKRHGLTQEQLAERISVSTKHIGSIERADSIPSIQVLVALANELQVTADYLLLESLPDKSNIYETEILNLLQGKPERLLQHFIKYIHLLMEEVDLK